ncbi:MAG: hypothetical protein JRL30_27725, partial [Deltaproteobacteria bacterium]|nr:hypothetical protein [Deltaproteobacteria bacterium]
INYASAQHGNGFYTTVNGRLKCADLTTMDADVGACEFWIELRHINPLSALGYWWNILDINAPSGGRGPALNFHVFGNTIRLVGVSNAYPAGGTFVQTSIGTAWDNQIGRKIHCAILWDTAGGLGGGENKMALKIDNVYQAMSVISGRSNSWVFPPYTTIESPNPVILGRHPTVTTLIMDRVIFDNIKMWDYAKTDYSDRFVE